MTTADYDGYAEWKRWDPAQFMHCSTYTRRYFEGETTGLDLAGKRVIELGFGNGGFLRFAKDAGASVGGTELLAEARARAMERGVCVYMPDLSDAVAETAGAFDLVVAFDVMEHMTREQLLALFDTLAALLKSGGHVLARFPNAQSPLGCVSQNGDTTHRSALSAKVLTQILTGKPWTIVRAGNPYMVLDADSLTQRIGLQARHAARRGVEWAVNRLYGLDITLDPNVTVLLRRR